MTKANANRYATYKNATASRLEQLYNKCSVAKRQDYESCWERFLIDDGYDFRVFSANTFSFSAGWMFLRDDKEYCHIETSSNMYEFCVEE